MRSCASSLDFRYVAEPRIAWVFQNPSHTSTMTQVCDGSTGGNNFGRARSALTWRWNHCYDTLPSGDVLSNSSENKRLCHVIPWVQTLCRAHILHADTMVCCHLPYDARSSEHVQQILSSRNVYEPLDLEVALSTIPLHDARVFTACFRSGRGRERCYRLRFCTSCRVLKSRTRSILSPVCAAEPRRNGCCVEHLWLLQCNQNSRFLSSGFSALSAGRSL